MNIYDKILQIYDDYSYLQLGEENEFKIILYELCKKAHQAQQIRKYDFSSSPVMIYSQVSSWEPGSPLDKIFLWCTYYSNGCYRTDAWVSTFYADETVKICVDNAEQPPYDKVFRAVFNRLKRLGTTQYDNDDFITCYTKENPESDNCFETVRYLEKIAESFELYSFGETITHYYYFNDLTIEINFEKKA